MLFIISVFLIIFWLLGLITSFTMGGFIHILFAIAILIILYGSFRAKKFYSM